MRSFCLAALVLCALVLCDGKPTFAQGAHPAIPLPTVNTEHSSRELPVETYSGPSGRSDVIYRWYDPAVLVPEPVLKVAGISLLLLAGFLLYSGLTVGKGRPRFTGHVASAPPEGMSPAVARMIMHMGYDSRTLAAVLVSLATKGVLSIAKDGNDFVVAKSAGAAISGFQETLLTELHDGQTHSVADLANTLDVAPKHIRAAAELLIHAGYPLSYKQDTMTLDPSRTPGDTAGSLLSEDEKAVLGDIFYDRDRLEIVGQSKGYLGLAVNDLKTQEQRTIKGRYYLPNTLFLTISIVLGVAVSLFTGFQYYIHNLLDPFATCFMLAGYLFLIGRVIQQWIVLLSGKAHKAGVMVFWMLVGTAITSGFFFIGLHLNGTIPLILLLAVTLTMWGNMWLYRRLKVPTAEGLPLMEATDGFRCYLQQTPDEARFTSPGSARTPQLFEAYLPYAIALEVEDAWAQQFLHEYPGKVQFSWSSVEYIGVRAAAHELGAALTYAIELAVNDANAKNTEVTKVEEEEEEAEESVTTN